MDSLIFLIFHVLLYGLSPLLVVTIFRAFKSTSFFYSYFGFLFVFTQLFAVLYSIKISENLILTGGNIAYSSIILITLFFGIASQDPAVVRNLISIQVIFNFILFFLYQLLIVVLNEPSTINLFNVSSGIFNTTITINIVSSLVFVIEVIFMFYSLEKIKEHIKHLIIVISLYVGVYIGILCLDGFLFPFIVSFFEPKFGQFIVGNVQGKLILGALFSPFLLTFMILHKKSLALFIKESFPIRLLIFPKRKQLIEKLRKVEQNLKITEQRYEEAYNRATFYKDLFTHDISNIINNISMSFSLLERKMESQLKINLKKSDGLLNTIENQLIRGKKLITNIRKLAEIDEDDLKLKSTNLLEYLAKAINFVKESFPQKHVEINVETVEKQIVIDANELLADIFENILVNAVKYNDNSVPEISIKISKAELSEVNYMKLEFKDNGIGIQDFKKEKIFLEGHKDLKGEKGMGIGLSLITKIINLYKGKIWVEDRIQGDYSKGSNFIVLFPEAKNNS